MRRQYYAYIYCDPSREWNGAPEPIYVGKGFGARSHKHLDRKDKHPFTQRLQKMIREGTNPLILQLPVSNEDIAFELEIGLISSIGRKDLSRGPLLNLTDGGDGIRNLSSESRKKISDKAYLREFSPDERQKMSESARLRYEREGPRLGLINKGRIPYNKGKRGVSEETRQKMSVAAQSRVPWNKGMKTGLPSIAARPDVREKISAAKKGRMFTEAHRQALSEAAKNRYKRIS